MVILAQFIHPLLVMVVLSGGPGLTGIQTQISLHFGILHKKTVQ